MNNINIAIISTEIFSVLLCLILLCANKFETRRKTKRSLVFSTMAVADILALICDAVSWIFDGKAEYGVLLHLTTTASIVLSVVLIALFNLYIWNYIRDRKKTSQYLFCFVMSFCAFFALLTLIACLTGHMFSYENGAYVTGPLYPLYTVANIVCILCDLFFILHFRKDMASHDLSAVFIYMSIPIASAVMTVFFPEWSFSYPAATLSLAVLYIMMQSEQGRQLENEKEIIHFHSMHDEMTGLNSRRAYMDKLAETSGSPGNTGVIFGDLNGLKYTNDNFGHEAGDKLIIKFSRILSDVFNSDCIYRISGDEFVVIMSCVQKDAFDRKLSEFEKALDKTEPTIAAIGSAFGACSNVAELVKISEMNMYVKKEQFHREHPKMLR